MKANANPVKVSQTKLLIDGKFVESADGRSFATINPATEEKIADVAEGAARDIDLAIKSARQAFDSGPWRKATARERGRLLYKLAELVDKNLDELAKLETLDNGKPISDSLGWDVPGCAAVLRYYAGWADKIHGQTIPMPGPFFTYTKREPVGVCGQIIPWNFPLCMAAWKIGPALAAGCTVVLKPAEQTPLTALRLGELALEAGLPAGVLNIVPGFGPTAGAALVKHPGVDKIAFTGETKTAQIIMREAADGLKRLTFELGGKSPNIIFADADLDAALIGSVWAIYYSAGQSCEARSRILVQDEVYDAFASAFVEKAKALTVGDPLADDTKVGSLISRAQAERVLGYVDLGVSDGGELLVGGAVDGELAEGLDAAAFVRPTVIGGVANDSRIAQEEVFGPVVTLTRFSDEAEAIRFANEVKYGLAATVWTGDAARGHRLAQRIRSGMIGINTPFVAFPGVPFGGVKDSGYGREQSLETLDLYTETKAILQGTSAKPINPFGV